MTKKKSDKKQFTFWLSSEEFEQANHFSAKYGMTVTKLAKYFLLNQSLPDTSAEIAKRNEYKKYRNEVKRVGVNISQIARALNQLLYRLDDFKRKSEKQIFSIGYEFETKKQPTTKDLQETLTQMQQEIDVIREELNRQHGDSESTKGQ